FFFSSRRRHTRSKRDWSSDVCSSDLRSLQLAVRPFVLLWAFLEKIALAVFGRLQWSPPQWFTRSRAATSDFHRVHPRITASGIEIGRASCRERVEMSVVGVA